MKFIKQNTINNKFRACFKIFISLFLACLLVFGLCPIKAFAESGQNSNIDQVDNGCEPKFPKVKIDGSFLKDLLGCFPMGSITKSLVGLLVPRLFPCLNPDSSYDPTMEMLEEIMAQLNDVKGMINNQTKILINENDRQSYEHILEIINDSTNYSGTVNLVMKGLDDIEECHGLKENPKKEIAESEQQEMAAERTTRIMTAFGMDIQPGKFDYEIDNYENWMYKLLDDKYDVSVNGVARHLNISQIFAEYARLNPNFMWEHEAEDYLDAAMYNLLINYLTVSSIDYVSILARIKVCEEKNIDFDCLEQKKISIEERYKQMKEWSERPYTSEEGGFKVIYGQDNPVRHMWSRANGANCDYYIQSAEVGEKDAIKDSGYTVYEPPFLSDFRIKCPKATVLAAEIYTQTNKFPANECFSGTVLGEKKEGSWNEVSKKEGVVMPTPNENNKPNDFWSQKLYKCQVGELLNSNEIAEILKAGNGQNLMDILYRAYGGDNAIFEDPHADGSPMTPFSTQINQIKSGKGEALDKMRVLLSYDDPNGYGFTVNHTGKASIKYSTEWTDYWEYKGTTTLSCNSLPLNANTTFLSGAKSLPSFDKTKTDLMQAVATQVRMNNGFIVSQESMLCRSYARDSMIYLYKSLKCGK